MRSSVVSVIGEIWQPGVICAMDYTMSPQDVAEVFSLSSGLTFSEAIGEWLTSRTLDFSSVQDFRVELPGCEIPWLHEESELTYNDCMYGQEE